MNTQCENIWVMTLMMCGYAGKETATRREWKEGVL